MTIGKRFHGVRHSNTIFFLSRETKTLANYLTSGCVPCVGSTRTATYSPALRLSNDSFLAVTMRNAFLLSAFIASALGSNQETCHETPSIRPICNWVDGFILNRVSSFSLFVENDNPHKMEYTETSPYTIISEDCQKCLDAIVNESETSRMAFDDMFKEHTYNMDQLRPMELKFRRTCFTSYRSIWERIAPFWTPRIENQA
jgi:hypothetical protein